jgi:hypothetical protein
MAAKKGKKPSTAEIAKLKKELQAVTKEFFSAHGDSIDFIMMGPPGPRPPPKLEWKVLNLSSY